MIAHGCNTLWVDGTFNVCPTPFTQLVTILTSVSEGTEVNDRVQLFPRMYCLLPSKTAQVYTFLFNRILQKLEAVYHVPREQLPWRNISMDFENGFIAGLQTVFPPLPDANQPAPLPAAGAQPPLPYTVELLGRNFHFCQAVYKLLANINHLTAAYRAADTLLRQFVKQLCALVFLPEDRVQPCFQALRNAHVPALYDGPQLQAFLDYVRDPWILNVQNRHMSNVFNRPLGRRTNNEVEGFYYYLSSIFDKHQNLWS